MAQLGTLNGGHRGKDWQKTQDDLERSRNKIQVALKAAKERSKKNINLADDIDTKFNQLQVLGIKLMDILRESGLDQRHDWIGLTEKMCQLLVPLSAATPFMSSSEERDIRQKDLLDRQKEMMELTRLIGRKLLFEGKHNQAVPAAVQSLKFSIDVHGLNSTHLVPSYLILAEANIGLGKLTQADEYLAQAEWTVLKSPDAKDSVRSKLFRNIGLLHAAKGDYENALRMLAEDIYHASCEWDSNHIRTSGGYFHMANVFFRQNKMDTADTLYTQVVDIWHNFLKDAVERKRVYEEELAAVGPFGKTQDTEKYLDEAQEAEAIQMLSAVFDIRDQSSKRQVNAISKICHTLSKLYYILDDIPRSKDYGRKAKSLGDHSKETEESTSLLNFLQFLEEGH
ncbi:zinc finger MYND domain-containing protein 12-like [Styela clava]